MNLTKMSSTLFRCNAKWRTICLHLVDVWVVRYEFLALYWIAVPPVVHFVDEILVWMLLIFFSWRIRIDLILFEILEIIQVDFSGENSNRLVKREICWDSPKDFRKKSTKALLARTVNLFWMTPPESNWLFVHTIRFDTNISGGAFTIDWKEIIWLKFPQDNPTYHHIHHLVDPFRGSLWQ